MRRSRRQSKRFLAALLFGGPTLVVMIASTLQPAVVREGLLQTAAEDHVLVEISAGAPEAYARLATRWRAEDPAPTGAGEAARLAGLALTLFSQTGNEQYSLMAGEVLAPWMTGTPPTPDLWLLRGRYLQGRHRFREAAADFQAFRQVFPHRSDALLMEADAWLRNGSIPEARHACLALALAGDEWLARHCTAAILLVLGRDEAGLAVLQTESSLQDSDRAVPAWRWALALKADLLAANGQKAAALVLWEQILGSEQSLEAGEDSPGEVLPGEVSPGKEPSLAESLAYADLLISAGRLQQALDWLEGLPAGPTVSLRKALALKRAGDERAGPLIDMLYQVYEAGKRGPADEELHLREQAMANLWLFEDTERAMQLALANWRAQRGWEDASLLLQAAREAGDGRLVQAVLDWRESRHRESL